MWLKKIRLENIKCFADTRDIYFTNKQAPRSKKPYRWITLLGENGVGKTTMLQTMGLLLAGPEASKELLPRPEGWLRDSSKPGKMTGVLYKEAGDQGVYGSQKKRRQFAYSYLVTGNKPITVRMRGRKDITKETYTEPALIEETTSVLSWLRTHAFVSGNQGWFAVGYGAFRRLTREHRVLLPGLAHPTRASNFSTQFNEDDPLSSFERWMVYLDFRIAKDPDDAQAKRMRDLGRQAIARLLPGDVKIKEITTRGEILFEIDGQTVPTVSMSDGYRSVIALAGDLIWRLLQTFPDKKPEEAAGVVLIDELDIHLHPTWQREIAKWLQDTFPKLQFFIATHSPLIAVGAGENALTLRFEANKQTGAVSITKIDDISAYDIDRALRSPAFNLVSTYSPDTQEKIEKYHQLSLRLPDLEPDDRRLYSDLQEFMKKAQPLNGNPEPGSLKDRMNQFLEGNLP